MPLILKAVLSGLIVAAASVIAKKFPLWGAVMVSVPFISLLTAIWLNRDTHDIPQVAAFLRNVFWAHIPTLAFFLICPALLRLTGNFWLSVGVSLAATAAVFFAYAAVLRQFGIHVYES
jgi:hypothetical protein